MWTILRSLLALAVVVLALAGLGHAAGGDLVLPGGVALEGVVVAADAEFLEVRVGTAVYVLERGGLSGAALEGLPAVDGRAALIEALLPHLTADDARVRRAARAAVLDLGRDAAPLLAAARRRSATPELQAALDTFLDALRARTGATER